MKLGGKASLLRAVVKMFWMPYLCIGLLLFLMQAIQILQTLSMGWMLRSLTLLPSSENKSQLQSEIYIYAAGICISQMVYVIGMNPYYFLTVKIGMQIRIACCSLIYRKAVRLSKSAFADTTAGQIVNLLSNDVNRFDICPIYPFYMIVGPLQTVVVVYILWPYFGDAVLYGVAILLLYIPLQAFMGKTFSILRSKAAVLTDERVRLMNEFIPAMRVIKMYAWEKPFATLVDMARRREISKIRYSATLRAINLGLFNVAAKIILFVVYIIHVFRGGQLSAESVFVAMSLINQIRLSTTLFLPYAISTGAEAFISFKRIKKFLLLPEKEDQTNIERSTFITRSVESEVVFQNVSSSWTKTANVTQNERTLSKLSFHAKSGELMAIVGTVGAGKTSILMTILGELHVIGGTISTKGRISYASQEPWTFAGSVRENIVYGSEFDQAKYKKVIEVCALQTDLSLFPNGDCTFVGERGVSLSGGQRARINLARCLYHDSDIYLLDDPLSAVDAAVAKHIFERSIQHYLKNKIVILVTHQLQFI
ncbi:multidrug resistance-associated protein 4-like protein, partial [Leptotrombidium deliense]